MFVAIYLQYLLKDWLSDILQKVFAPSKSESGFADQRVWMEQEAGNVRDVVRSLKRSKMIVLTWDRRVLAPFGNNSSA